ncbi:MAG: PilZ domain-containing protein [Myxococcales bacterium]|nr:PilZ domain-containing protein [Myxococcales bacterium]
MQTQHHPRYKKRIPCEFEDDQGHHLGMVLNVSQSGLFLSSRVTPRVGSKIVLHLSPGSGPRSTDVAARVVWKRKVHRSAQVMGDGGFGLEIEGACEGYDRLMRDLVPAMAHQAANAQATAEEGGACEPTPATFCVRAALAGTPRTRSLEIRAVDDQEACARALGSLGEGWQILGVAPVTPKP